jgi:hypothetical protein
MLGAKWQPVLNPENGERQAPVPGSLSLPSDILPSVFARQAI